MLERHDSSALPPRHSHRRPRAGAEPMLDECEPLSGLAPGIASSFLVLIDRALELNDLAAATRVERLLPPSLGSDPAVVDRRATLRILEGDLATAGAALGGCPMLTPRLDLLRAILTARRGDSFRLFGLVHGASSGASLGLRTLAALLSRAVLAEGGYRLTGDPIRAVCDACRERSNGPIPGPSTIGRTVRQLLRLLGRTAPRGTLAAALIDGLREIAADLGLEAEPPASGLAVTPEDRDRLHLRVA